MIVCAQCNTLQHIATHCNTLQHTVNWSYGVAIIVCAHCNTLQHTATHCNTLPRTATHCNTLQHIATHCNTLQHTATHCNTLQHSATAAVHWWIAMGRLELYVIIVVSHDWPYMQCVAVCGSVLQWLPCNPRHPLYVVSHDWPHYKYDMAYLHT